MSGDIMLLFGTVIAVSFLGNALFEKARLPDTVSLIAMGAILGGAFGLGPSESVQGFMASFGKLALAIILLRTGLELDLRRSARHAGRASLLALFAFLIVLFLGYCAFSVGLDLHGRSAWAISAALACMSAGIAMPLLAKSHPGEGLAPILSLESALTEAFSIILVLALSVPGLEEGPGLAFWGRQGLAFLIGGGIGLVLGFLWLWLLGFLARRGFFYLLTLGMVFLLMDLVDRAGGSGVVAVLTLGMTLANGESAIRIFGPTIQARLRPFLGMSGMRSVITESHEQIYFLIRGFFLLYLGTLLAWPGQDLASWLAIVVASVSLIVGRVIAVQLSGWIAGLPGRDRAFLRIATPRGLTTAILIAILLPRVGQGAWVSVSVAVILASNLWMALAAARLARKTPLDPRENE